MKKKNKKVMQNFQMKIKQRREKKWRNKLQKMKDKEIKQDIPKLYMQKIQRRVRISRRCNKRR